MKSFKYNWIDSMFPDEIDRSDAADRKRKQQEYHCILDQQIAEKKLLKNQQERMYKTASDDFENGSSQLDSSINLIYLYILQK